MRLVTGHNFSSRSNLLQIYAIKNLLQIVISLLHTLHTALRRHIDISFVFNYIETV